MKRFVIFAGLGPLLGFITVTALIQGFNYALDGATTLQFGYLVLLPVAYGLGLVPALFAAWFDHAVRRTRCRIVWTSLFAYFAGFMPVFSALVLGFLNTPYVLIVGLVGLVPGAICSWLSGGDQFSRDG